MDERTKRVDGQDECVPDLDHEQPQSVQDEPVAVGPPDPAPRAKKPPFNSPPGKVSRRQVESVVVDEFPAVALLTALAPAVDAVLDSIVVAMGTHLHNLSGDSILSVVIKMLLYFLIRVINQGLRDDSGSTLWLWQRVFRGVRSAFRAVVQILFRKPRS